MTVSEALESAWRDEGRSLFSYLLGVTGDRGAAEDLLSEAFVRAARAWEEQDVPSDPAAWLQRVCVNLARSRWRRIRTSVAHLSRQREDCITPAAGPERVLVWTALKALSPKNREVLVLHYILDRPLDDIAEALGAPLGTIKARLSRARTALAEELGCERESTSRSADAQGARTHA